MPDLRVLWACIWRPKQGFESLAAGEPALLPSLGRLMLLRTPVAYLAWILGVLSFVQSYAALKNLDGEAWRLALPLLTQANPDLDLQVLRAFLAQLPALPRIPTLLAWGLVVAPVGVLGVWLHDAAWDHGCLWMLGGLKSRKGFRRTLVAESEALSVGVFGALAALLGQLPVLGWALGLPLMAVGAWFWVLRGWSLAAFHGIPPWKGVAATLLHILLAGCCLAGLVAFMAILVFMPVGS